MKNNTHMGDKNILFIAILNKKYKLFKHEQQETHLDTKNEKTNTLSWIFRVLHFCGRIEKGVVLQNFH